MLKGYLVFALRRQHQDSYRQWEIVDIVEYVDGVNSPEFCTFRCTDVQGLQVIDGLQANRLFIKWKEMSETGVNGWVTEEFNGEIVDLREIPDAYNFVIEEPRPVEVVE